MSDRELESYDEDSYDASGTEPAESWSRSAADLDDDADWKELRARYYGLLQELRVILPGAQVLVAFLLTAPFATNFDRLDQAGKFLFGVATVSGLMAVITLLTPTVFHRVADRRFRSARLVWAVRCTLVGLVLLAVALITALLCVTRHVYSTGLALAITALVTAATIMLWGVLPRTAKPNHIPGRTAETEDGRPEPG